MAAECGLVGGLCVFCMRKEDKLVGYEATCSVCWKRGLLIRSQRKYFPTTLAIGRRRARRTGLPDQFHIFGCCVAAWPGRRVLLSLWPRDSGRHEDIAAGHGTAFEPRSNTASGSRVLRRRRREAEAKTKVPQQHSPMCPAALWSPSRPSSFLTSVYCMICQPARQPAMIPSRREMLATDTLFSLCRLDRSQQTHPPVRGDGQSRK